MLDTADPRTFRDLDHDGEGDRSAVVNLPAHRATPRRRAPLPAGRGEAPGQAPVATGERGRAALADAL